MCPCSFLVHYLAIVSPEATHNQFCNDDVAKVFSTLGLDSMAGFCLNGSFTPPGIHDGRKYLW